MILGVILARGGSKRLPRKNLRLLGGRPLVAWTILAAQKATMLDRLVLSTEDQEIAEVAQDYGCEVVKRPIGLATDSASSYAALLHAIDFIVGVSAVVLLQPTSPLRGADDIDGAVGLHMMTLAPVASRTYGGTVPNGAIYVATPDWLRAGGNWDGEGVLGYRMPSDRSVDIDTLADFEEAERLVA